MPMQTRGGKMLWRTKNANKGRKPGKSLQKTHKLRRSSK